MTLLFMTSFGSPLKPRYVLKSGTEQERKEASNSRIAFAKPQ
jgi:hypothetical protein